MPPIPSASVNRANTGHVRARTRAPCLHRADKEACPAEEAKRLLGCAEYSGGGVKGERESRGGSSREVLARAVGEVEAWCVHTNPVLECCNVRLYSQRTKDV